MCELYDRGTREPVMTSFDVEWPGDRVILGVRQWILSLPTQPARAGVGKKCFAPGVRSSGLGNVSHWRGAGWSGIEDCGGGGPDSGRRWATWTAGSQRPLLGAAVFH